MTHRAAELGLKAIAITDRDGVYGIPKAFHASREHAGLKLITGAELTLTLPGASASASANGAPARLTLLAQNRAGYGLMCRMLTASHCGHPSSYDESGAPTREKGQAALDWEYFLELASREEIEGLYALPELPSPGAMPGAMSDRSLDTLREIFRGRIALPLARLLDGRDAKRSEEAVALSRRFDIPIVATNDAHFHIAERRVLHDVMTSIREITPLDKIGFRIHSNAERYLKSPAEMAQLFRDLPEALRLTLEIAERCQFSPAELRYRYPSEWIPDRRHGAKLSRAADLEGRARALSRRHSGGSRKADSP